MTFRAMADATRRNTLAVLRGHELTVSELVEVLRQPQSTVSRHLKTLRDAGLIVDRRDGSAVHYSLPPMSAEGDADDLRVRLLDWVGTQPVSRSIGDRLRRVLDERREMSNRFFNRIARHWDALREKSFGATFHLEAFCSLLPSEWIVADVGAGTGYLLGTLARHFKRVVAIEPVDSMLEVSRQRVTEDGLGNCELLQGDLAALPLADGRVDLAVAMLVLHHVPSPRDAVAELGRVVTDDGRVLIVEQTAHQFSAFRDRMQDRWWGFDPADLAGHLRSAGFSDVRSRALPTEASASDVPELFVMTARRTGS